MSRAFVSVAEGGGYRVERKRGSAVAEIARLLLADGCDPQAELQVLDSETDQPRLMPQPLGRWAKTAVEESDGAGLKVRRWRPGPSERVRQATVERHLDPSGGQGTGEAEKAPCERTRRSSA